MIRDMVKVFMYLVFIALVIATLNVAKAQTVDLTWTNTDDTNITRVRFWWRSPDGNNPTAYDTTSETGAGQTYTTSLSNPPHDCIYGKRYLGGTKIDEETNEACGLAAGGSATLSWTPQPPAECPWDAALLASDPLCVECPWVGGLLESDPACVQPYTEDVGLTWTEPTENEDGTPLEDLAGYRVYYTLTPGQYSMWDTVSAPAAAHTVADLTEGQWEFVNTAYDTSGNQSAFSNTTSKLIAQAAGPCPWDGSIADDDPLCVECQYVPGILESDPLCVPPTGGLKVVDGNVFKVQAVPDGFVRVFIGTAPVGTDCIEDQEVNGYNVVPNDQVTWVGVAEPIAVVALCQ